MPYDALKNRILEARDHREESLRKVLAYCDNTVIFLSLNIPGGHKTPPGCHELFAWGARLLHTALPPLRPLYRSVDELGPWALFSTGSAPVRTKKAALAVEQTHPASRLLDIDVYRGDGVPVDRDALELPQRPCLICPEPARECIRLGRHNSGELLRRVHELLAPFRP